MTQSPKSRHQIQGFSLVEMAIVLTIVGLLMATLLPSLTSQMEQQRRVETRKQLEDIRQALMGFAVMNGRLPCPTTQTDPANANYGMEAGSCNSNPSAEGYLPWKTLGVLEIDAWGTKRSVSSSSWNGYWRYRVDREFSNSGSLITLTEVPHSNDALTIRDSSGNSLISTSERPVALVFSTGPDLLPNGQNASFESGGTPGIYESDVPGSSYDDMLIWLSRPQLFNRMVAAGKLP
jgi:prepilin-type N-terminal cleavage/methylation domain-containing protein